MTPTSDQSIWWQSFRDHLTIRAFPGHTAVPAGTPIRELERQLLETTLQLTGGNRTRAAEMLGISLRTIRNKIREFGLPPRRFA